MQILRYGENPHQQAAFYADGSKRPGVATARQVQGKELSYNNINDTDAAYECVAEFSEPAVVVIKHANPSGVAIGSDQYSAYLKAYACDPVSIYGGIVAVNRTLEAVTATDLAKRFLEVIIAPDATPEALRDPGAAQGRARAAGRHAARSGERRHDPEERGRRLSVPEPRQRPRRTRRPQGRDQARADRQGARGPAVRLHCLQAREVERHRLCQGRRHGRCRRGPDEPPRLLADRRLRAAESGEIAKLAQSPAIGSVVASDAFFPFADGLLAAAEAGATAVIQPGGSMRDKEVIEAADKAGLAMVFTGMRHFRH